MKRILLLFSLLLCGVVHVVAQPQVEKYTHKFDDGKYYDEVGYSSESLGLYTWKVEGATNASVAKCDIFLRHFNYYLHTLLYFRFVSINKNQFAEPVKRVELLLTNGERLNFEANNLNKTSYIAFTFEPYHNFLRRTLYTSSFRKFPTINRNDYSDEGLESWDKLEIESSWYLYNQLALYDIKQMIIDKKITLSPLFRSSDFFKPLIAELRSSLDDKSPLPDINNLDRSWARKEINIKVESDSHYGDRVTWDDYIATTTDPKIDFRFSLLPRGNRAIIDFFSLGYSIPDWLSYTDKFSPMTITLANGVQYRTTKAVLQPTLTSRRVNIRVGAEDFVDVRNPSVKMAPKTMLQQLAKYDVVEVKFLKHTIDLRNADGSTAELFGKMCKALLKKTGVADLYALNTPAPAVRPTTTTPKKTTTAKPTETTTKPAQATKQEPTGFLLTAHNKLKYARYIARYDHIAPAQLMNTPLALVTSRAIPMDALLEIVDGAKGVGKVTVSTSSDGKQKSATVHPTEFYCRLRGFEEVPCSLMSVGYDADNAQQIKTATFTYDLPASWKRGKVKEYAKAFSDDMHRLGMRWSEANDSYVGSHEGHYIQIRYGGKGADNFIYVYIRYAEEQ